LENSLAGQDNVKVTRAAAVCILAFGLAACTELFGPTWASRIGSIVNGTLVVPDTVAAGATFVVTLNTSGNGCAKAGYTTTLMVDSLTAEIRPYDYQQVNPSACTTIQASFLHADSLQFRRTGIATLRVIGAYNDSTITTTRTVVVR
jgi:hypothetical protein